MDPLLPDNSGNGEDSRPEQLSEVQHHFVTKGVDRNGSIDHFIKKKGTILVPSPQMYRGNKNNGGIGLGVANALVSLERRHLPSAPPMLASPKRANPLVDCE
jgi:hypothetical protein